MLEQYYRINEAAGVSIHIQPDGSVLTQLCSVAATGNELSIDKKVTDLKAVGQLKEHVGVKSVIALNLLGKGILQKKIEKTAEIDQNNFSIILPNANIEDFYIQNFVSGESSFVSVIRKLDADKWINQLTELGFRPLMLSLGPFPVENVISQLNIYDGDVIFNGHIITRDEKAEWTAYSYSAESNTPFPIKIASEKIDEKLIIPYAVAFQLVLVNEVEPIKADVDSLEDALVKRLSDNKIKLQSFILLIVLFMLLLANFITFSSLNAANAGLLEKVSRFAQNTNTQQSINEEVKKKEGQLQALGWDGAINKSSLIDQVASLLPPEVSLNEIAINPVDQATSRTNKSLVFYNRKIRITGNSQKIIPVNEWIARIKSRKWVKNIQMESFTFDNELNTGEFNITIDY